MREGVDNWNVLVYGVHMTAIQTAGPETVTKPRRPWNRHAFYMSDQMALVARAIARREQERSGRQTGAGQIVDRAMREYAESRLAPGELATLLNGNSHD